MLDILLACLRQQYTPAAEEPASGSVDFHLLHELRTISREMQLSGNKEHKAEFPFDKR